MPPIMDKMTDRLAGLTLGPLALLHAGYPDRPILIAGDHAIGNPSASSTPLHDFAHHTTVLRGFRPVPSYCDRGYLSVARRDAGASQAARDDVRGPRGRPPHTVAGGTPPGGPPGRRERLPMGPHRRRVPSCRGNGKRDRMIREIVQGSTRCLCGEKIFSLRPSFLPCVPLRPPRWESERRGFPAERTGTNSLITRTRGDVGWPSLGALAVKSAPTRPIPSVPRSAPRSRREACAPPGR